MTVLYTQCSKDAGDYQWSEIGLEFPALENQFASTGNIKSVWHAVLF